MKNNAKKWALISVFFTLAGVIMTAAGFIIDEYDYFWVIFVGLILAVFFFVCFLIFSSQARHLEKMFSGENLLARWSFDQTNQLLKAKDIYNETKKRNIFLLGIVLFFFVIISAFFVAFGFDSFEEALGFIGIMSAVLLLISVVALTAPGFAFIKMQKSDPLVLVSREAAWVMGVFFKWKAAMTRADYVELIRSSGKTVIVVHFSIFQRYGYQRHECRIPVPDDCGFEAQQVAAEIAGYCKAELRVFDRK